MDAAASDRLQADHRTCQCGLAGAGLAHQSMRLADGDGEIDSRDGGQRRLSAAVANLHAAKIKWVHGVASQQAARCLGPIHWSGGRC